MKKITQKEIDELPPLPKAKGVDLQWRLMLCGLAKRAAEKRERLWFWQRIEKQACDKIIFETYKALAG